MQEKYDNSRSNLILLSREKGYWTLNDDINIGLCRTISRLNTWNFFTQESYISDSNPIPYTMIEGQSNIQSEVLVSVITALTVMSTKVILSSVGYFTTITSYINHGISLSWARGSNPLTMTITKVNIFGGI